MFIVAAPAGVQPRRTRTKVAKVFITIFISKKTHFSLVPKAARQLDNIKKICYNIKKNHMRRTALVNPVVGVSDYLKF